VLVLLFNIKPDTACGHYSVSSRVVAADDFQSKYLVKEIGGLD
jgi:hypothetical protein